MYNSSSLDSQSITDLKQTGKLDPYCNSGTNSVTNPFNKTAEINSKLRLKVIGSDHRHCCQFYRGKLELRSYTKTKSETMMNDTSRQQ